MSVQDRLREIVREAIRDSGVTQRAIAAELGVSEQHISRMLTGRAVLTLEWTEKIVAVCGRQVSVALLSPGAASA